MAAEMVLSAMLRLTTACLLVLALAAPTGAQSLRPEFTGTHAVVAAGRTYTVEAGAELVSKGGTAIDAGIASVFAAAVVEISHFGLGGEAPMVIYLAKTREVVVINERYGIRFTDVVSPAERVQKLK